MITVKDGQIIVTELRPMSEIKFIYCAVLAFSRLYENIHLLIYLKYEQKIVIYPTCKEVNEEDYLGFVMAPIYQPQQKLEPVYLECGE